MTKISVNLEKVSPNVFDIDLAIVKGYFKNKLFRTIQEGLKEALEDINFQKEISRYANKVILKELKNIRKTK